MTHTLEQLKALERAATPGPWEYDGMHNENFAFIAAARTAVPELIEEVESLRNALMTSEGFRRAYQDGKYKLYSMGGEVCDAAGKHLPCSEGPLDRYTAKVEREHSPQLVEKMRDLAGRFNAQEVEAQKLLTALKSAIAIADQAFREWDNNIEPRNGKLPRYHGTELLASLLRYLGDPSLRGYRADIDAIHEAVKTAETFLEGGTRGNL